MSSSSSLTRSLQELVKQWTVGGRSSNNQKDNDEFQEATRVPGAANMRVVQLPEPTPTTPVGLKPRRSVSSLKTSLGIASTGSAGSTYEDDLRRRPRSSAAQSSSSTTIASPVVSTSSFYGGASSIAGAGSGSLGGGQSSSASSHLQQVAASPVLLPGRARTAVGALVAATSAAAAAEGPVSTGTGDANNTRSASSPLRGGMTATQTPDKKGLHSPEQLHHRADLMNRSLQSILPPFDDVDNYQYSGRSSRRFTLNEATREEDRSPSPVTNRPTMFDRGTMDEYPDDGAAMLRESLYSPDVVETFRSPSAGVGGTGSGLTKPRRILHEDDDPATIGAARAGLGLERKALPLAAAMDSLSPVRQRGGRRASSLSPFHSIVASPSSLAGDYMEPVFNHNDVHHVDDANGMPHDYSVSGSLPNDDPHQHDHDSPDSFRATDPRSPHDATLQKHKFANQRQAHEDLMLAALERLQDEKELVAEIQKQLGNDESTLDEPNDSLLTGLSTDTARRISTVLMQILKELDVTEQLLFSSPTDMAAVAVPRNDFRDAMRFCLQLVRASASTTTVSQGASTHGDTKDAHEMSSSKWRLLPGIKSSLGLIPESPQVPHRGGDTSVFSVPCEDSVATPMTSNVSISTTITTRTHLTAANLHSPSHFAHPPPRFHHQALEIRRTISTIATLLDRLSRLIVTDKLPTQDIKRVYLEMQTLDVASLKNVVEAFEIDQPESLMMLLSGSSASNDDDMSDVVPPPRATSGVSQHVSNPEPASQRHAPQDRFFSPILRSQSGNRLVEDGTKLEEEKEATVAVATGKAGLVTAPTGDAIKARAGRRGGSRRAGGHGHGLFRRTSSLKMQDPLNLS